MAKKILSTFTCSSCHHQSQQWLGKCPKCMAWNTFSEKEEENLQCNRVDKKKIVLSTEIKQLSYNRLRIHLDEFDRVMGGGLVEGSLTLLGGDPGIGKSTLLTSVLGLFAKYNKSKVLYISGEETVQQVGLRINRLELASPFFYVDHDTKWQTIEFKMRELKPKLVLIDSIQTIFSTEVASHPGSVSQVREVTMELMNYAKNTKTAMIIIGHITKDGSLAGPKLLEHMVDTVLYFESEKNSEQRILRPVKNRFGATNEIGIFEMNAKGMSAVINPLKLFLEQSEKTLVGNCIGKLKYSQREILCEVQALILENNIGLSKKVAQGFDLNRMTMLLAIIEKYLNIKLGTYDIYINITGPNQKLERQLDLPVIAAIVSSYRKKPIKKGMIISGELALGGTIKKCFPSNLSNISLLEKELF